MPTFPSCVAYAPSPNPPPGLTRRFHPLPPFNQKALPTHTHSAPPRDSTPSHQETVIIVPHEDQAQPGHHLQVATAELNEDPRLAEGQLNPVEESRNKVRDGGRGGDQGNKRDPR